MQIIDAFGGVSRVRRFDVGILSQLVQLRFHFGQGDLRSAQLVARLPVLLDENGPIVFSLRNDVFAVRHLFDVFLNLKFQIFFVVDRAFEFLKKFLKAKRKFDRRGEKVGFTCFSRLPFEISSCQRLLSRAAKSS